MGIPQVAFVLDHDLQEAYEQALEVQKCELTAFFFELYSNWASCLRSLNCTDHFPRRCIVLDFEFVVFDFDREIVATHSMFFL